MESGRENAVLFAELIGTAELYASAGDAAAHATIVSALEKLGAVAAACGARVLKTIGARMMVLAPSADIAARVALAMQETACELPAIAEGRLALGVGFHYGPVIPDQDDVFGDTVNLAARLVEQAAKGQILFAAETAGELSARHRRLMRRLYELPVKGRSEEVALCELVWRADQAPTMYPAHPTIPLHPKLRLKYHGKKLMLRDSHDAFTIGRAAECALVVVDGEVSRHHCTIQRRSDHFILADQSTNGTYVTVEGEGEVLLKREELTLRKRGWISLGGPRGAASEALEFFCD
jgi:adenylate cyclase